jgi:hypothetical protein
MLLIFFMPCIFVFFYGSLSLKSFEVLNVDSVCLNIGLVIVDIACVLCFPWLCCYLILVSMESIQHKMDDLILFSSFANLLIEMFGNMIKTP